MKTVFSVLFLAISTVGVLAADAPAQPEDQTGFLRRAMGVIESQRNEAMNSVVLQTTRANALQDDLQKAQARIKDLEKKYEPKDEAKPDDGKDKP